MGDGLGVGEDAGHDDIHAPSALPRQRPGAPAGPAGPRRRSSRRRLLARVVGEELLGQAGQDLDRVVPDAAEERYQVFIPALYRTYVVLSRAGVGSRSAAAIASARCCGDVAAGDAEADGIFVCRFEDREQLSGGLI